MLVTVVMKRLVKSSRRRNVPVGDEEGDSGFEGVDPSGAGAGGFGELVSVHGGLRG